MLLLSQISENLKVGNYQKVNELTKQAIEENIPPKKILDEGLIAGMDIVGEQFRKHEIFLPEVLLAAKAMYAGMDQLKPLFIGGKIPGLGRVVLGTVKGDVHDIGKNLVGVMLEGAGFEVIDLGKGISPSEFVEIAIKERADVIGMSALLTTTMPVMKEVIDKLKKENKSNSIKTIVGGAPVTEEFAQNIGADAYGYDAANAVVRIKKLVKG